MATGTNGIATVDDLVYGKGLNFPLGYSYSQCPTKEVILDMGGGVPSTYVSIQLVKYSDVTNAINLRTLTINTSTTYAMLGLFTTYGGTPNSSYNYTIELPDTPNVYKITFTQGAGIVVNNPEYPTYPVTIYHGYQYRVMGRVNVSNPWTLIATLTHFDGNKTEYI